MTQDRVQADVLPLDQHKLALLARAWESIPAALYCADDDGRLLYVNAHGRRQLGLAQAQLAGKSLHDIHPELSRRRWSTAAQAAREQGHWVVRFQQPQGGGDSVPMELSVGYQQIDGNDRYFCVTRAAGAADQSQRLLNLVAQATAAYSGIEFFRALVKHMADVMQVRHAFITECLDQPPSRVRMLAFWSGDDFDDNEEYDLDQTPCDIVINGRRDYLVEDGLGERYPVEAGFADSYYGVPIYDAEGRHVIGHLALLNEGAMHVDGLDCTVFEILASRASVELQRLRAENALKQSEAKYRLLVENQTDLILRLDPEAHLQFVSPSCCARFGQREADLLGRDLFSFVHKDDVEALRRAWQKALLPPCKIQCELRTLTRQGWCWCAWILKGVVDEQGRVSEVIAVGRDISERVQAEDKTRETIRKLAHVGRLSSMGEMASGLAHELNQPLTAIMSFAQASRRMLGNAGGDLDDYKAILDRIAANAELAGQIIQRVRGFVRKTEPVKQPVDLGRLIREVTGLLDSELRRGDIQFYLHLGNKLPPVSGDPIQIQQVLVNLVRNAIEAITEYDTQPREVTIRADVDTDNHVIVEVRDTGPGIPADTLNQLFDAFVTTKSDGLGIGLSICKTIIEAHGGTLSVQSRMGAGTLFRFDLKAFMEG